MRSYKIFTILLVFLVVSACTKNRVFLESDIAIIPKPVKTELKEGSFKFSDKTKIAISRENQRTIAQVLIGKFEIASGLKLNIVDKEPASDYITMVIDELLPKDAYSLAINNNIITIKASEFGGFLYAMESLIQLLPPEIESKNTVQNVDWSVPNILIEDQPRFPWRGLMLDISRHFFGKEYIKETIDGLSRLKMNVLHLHLVDDQGWRIEIKKYPKLTEIGAWRVDQEDAIWNDREKTKAGVKGTYGGFLSQEDLKEIVKYAKTKNVEIIPEIEMPAHVMSAIASYPELACFEDPIGVPSGGVWPITDIYCAGKESAFEFLENVLLEVMEIFPSKYIHIGGDEATKTNWEKCQHCQARMKKEGLKDEKELQSYFIKRIEKFINKHDKKLVGWDEILEGGLAPDATVMSWRGVKGGLEAAAEGHDVVMTPGTHCYFDHYQGPQNEEPHAIGGFLPLHKVYEFDPVVDGMNEEEAKHVLGGQANLWSEYITTNQHSQYMLYPRLSALAETVWSKKELRDWDDFSFRLRKMFKRYDYLGINYAKSAFLVTASSKVNLENRTVSLTLQNEFSNADIRYVLDNVDLNEQAIPFKEPIELQKTTLVKASLFEDNKPVGKIFIDTIKFHKAVAHQVNYITPFSDQYQGTGEFNMVNTLRGTKNFHDGQWQAWLGKDMEIVIDLESEKELKQVSVGSMENQGPGIYYPIAIEVFVSTDGETFDKVGEVKRAYVKNAKSELKDFKVAFPIIKARFIKVKAISLKKTPNNSGVWLFVDEIIID